MKPETKKYKKKKLKQTNASAHLVQYRFTSSYEYHLITVITFALVTYHCLYLSLQT